MIKLNLGSGPYLAPGYINVDKYFDTKHLEKNQDKLGHDYEKPLKDKKPGKFVEGDILSLPFKDEYADIVEAHQVLEHISIQDQALAFKEIYRVMKKGAKFILTVPSFNGLCLEWLGMNIRNATFNPQMWYDRAQEFYGIQVNEGEYHRCPMTPEWIAYCANEAGFKNVKRMILFGKNSAIPKTKNFGIVASSPKPYGDGTVFRHETIFCELVK